RGDPRLEYVDTADGAIETTLARTNEAVRPRGMNATYENNARIGRRRRVCHGKLAVTDLVQADHVCSQSAIPTITSDALMIANASCPTFKPSSSTASLVMEDVTTIRPPISILTCAVVAPLVTSMILPLRRLRALIFKSSLPF